MNRRQPITPLHCDNCGREISKNMRFCSETCANQWRARLSQKARKGWLTLIDAMVTDDDRQRQALMARVMDQARTDAEPAPDGLFARPQAEESDQ